MCLTICGRPIFTMGFNQLSWSDKKIPVNIMIMYIGKPLCFRFSIVHVNV